MTAKFSAVCADGGRPCCIVHASHPCSEPFRTCSEAGFESFGSRNQVPDNMNELLCGTCGPSFFPGNG